MDQSRVNAIIKTLEKKVKKILNEQTLSEEAIKNVPIYRCLVLLGHQF